MEPMLKCKNCGLEIKLDAIRAAMIGQIVFYHPDLCDVGNSGRWCEGGEMEAEPCESSEK